ncbi:Mannan polymerase II complex anp1 subunit [Friedmanniomyces endolithicus]|nr:Mannan polymerase II complex anp1 subunit [Friedmanniomyces endolithicus]KAK0880103.1 Mannan polymerase II complex anp1 subunit [Friedmanniomyces endolithicus]
MNRHGYGGHAGGGAYPMSPTMVEARGRTFNIRPDKYEKYTPRNAQSTLQRRRGLFLRLGAALAAILFLLMIFFPSMRPTALFPTLSLGLFSAAREAFQIETVRYYDLANVAGTSRGWEREERILLCAPLRDAAPHLPMFFSHLRNLTYPHNLIDLAFLVGDSKDNTLALLSDLLQELQAHEDPKAAFGEISIMEKDFGQTVNQDVESRHGFAAQASRRKSMAQARNWLLSAAMRPTHSWVYWRDVDVETAPFTILEDLMRHNKDVIVPNVWRPLPDWLGGEQPYDLNSWQESETALALADTLDEDAVIVEGYAEYATWRPHLAYLRDPYGDPDMEMEIDGVGGVSILAKAKVFRSGVHFPAFSFEKHAETEGFGKMAKRMGYSVVGLPHYTIWHLYEPSVDDIRHMEEMEQERKAREAEERERREREEKIGRVFDTEGREQWEKDRKAVEDAQNAEKETQRVKENAEAKGPEEPERRKANGEGVRAAGDGAGAKDVTPDPTPSSSAEGQPTLPNDSNKPATDAQQPSHDQADGKSNEVKVPSDTEERLASMAQQEEGGKAANVDKPATEAKEKGGSGWMSWSMICGGLWGRASWLDFLVLRERRGWRRDLDGSSELGRWWYRGRPRGLLGTRIWVGMASVGGHG